MYPWCWLFFVLLLQAVQFTGGSPTWPYGKYTLLKPRTGCPDGWDDRGYLHQDTIDEDPGNNRSETLHVHGSVDRTHVKIHFCSKAKLRERRKGTKKKKVFLWPSGQYCVYTNQGKSLSDMKTGSIVVYDIGNDYENKPKFIKFFEFLKKTFRSYRGTKVYYSCKTNGNKKRPISLPITKPFYLLPYGSRECQQVKWMVATLEWIKYHTRNYITKRGRKQVDGTVPYHELGDMYNKGITMYYCYYKKCRYTMRDKEGVFQSPGFPGQYPDGQLCSWRIMVPENHTLHVRFTHFSLDGKDILKYSQFNGSIRSWYTIPDSMVPPFTLSSNSTVRFVFRSDVSNTSTGFRAEYRVYMVKATTSTETTTLPVTKLSTISTTALPKGKSSTTKPSLSIRAEYRVYMVKATTSTETTTLPVTKLSTISTTVLPKGKSSTTKPSLSILSEGRKSTKTPSTPQPTLQHSMSKAETMKDSPFSSRNKAIIVMVVPVVCVLIGIILLILILYQCRVKRRKTLARNSKRGTERADGALMNPTYDRGTIILKSPNEATTANTALDGGDDPCVTPEYEDIEYHTSNKANPNRITKTSETEKSKSVERDCDPLYHVLELNDAKTRECPSQIEGTEPEVIMNSGPNPLYHVLEGPFPNNELPKKETDEDQSSSRSREGEVVKDSGPNPLYYMVNEPNPNKDLPSQQKLDDDHVNTRSRDAEVPKDSDPNPLYYVLEGPDSEKVGMATDPTYEEVY